MLMQFCIMLLSGLALTGLVRWYAVRRQVFDIPGERSSHTVPTPRGGGLSVILLVPVAMLVLYPLPGSEQLALIGLASATLALALVGWIDDHRPLSARFRFLAQLLIAAIGLAALPVLPVLPLGGYEISLAFPLLLPLVLVALVWLTNLYNFMDGINGLAAFEAVFVLLSAALLLSLDGAAQVPLLLMLSAPLLGFLYWNFPHARIFMGDVCSAPLGLLLALLGLWLAQLTPLNLWSWLILLSVFIVDASWTLLVRLFSGQRWAEPHRSHCYQILSRRWGSHARVVGAVMLVNAGWLLPLAWLAMQQPAMGAVYWLLACLPLLLVARTLKAGQPEC